VKLAAVLGWPVGHSRSPALHNAAYRAVGVEAVYAALPVPPDRLGAALAGVRALGFLGVNLTVPHKEAGLALCDDIDPVAARVGAVNTVVVTDGRLRGANTDVEGFARALAEAGGAAAGPAVLLGAGGAARAVVAALAPDREVRIVARTPARAAGLGTVFPWTAEALAQALAGAGLVVDCTPMALAPETDIPVEVDDLAADALVASLVYHREPALVARARARGLRVMDGAAMLVHQAALAFELMTGRRAPLEVMRAAMAYGPTER
jgi:shikimate dehydrogenase